MNDTAWTPVGSDSAYRYSATALSVFWPESEFHTLIARWPSLSAHLGATWDEYRRRTERDFALLDRDGLAINMVAGDVSGFEAFLAERRIKHPSVDDLLAYPDLRTAGLHMISWPPRRTANCWCDSGLKYKQCCRPHGLGTLE